MYCDGCGSEITEHQEFCGSCGKALTPGSQASPAASLGGQGRVARNLSILGVLWIVYSLLNILPMGALAFLPLAGPWTRGTGIGWDGVPVFVRGIIGPIAGFALLMCVLGIVAGWGLMSRKRWARVMAMIFGCLALLNIPFGTALGIYTLWVLAPSDSDREYQQLAGTD